MAAAEVLENLAFLANASNLVTYLTGFMYFSPARSATAVTNFMGTAFLLALLGGFLSDAFFTTYLIFIVSTAVEFLVLQLSVFCRSISNSRPPSPPPPTPEYGGSVAALALLRRWASRWSGKNHVPAIRRADSIRLNIGPHRTPKAPTENIRLYFCLN